MINIERTSRAKSRRPGRQSRLDLFKEQSGPIHPFSTELLNDMQWFARYAGFIVRDSCSDDTCAIDLEVCPAMAQRIRENLDRLSNTAVYDHFTLWSESTRRVPPFPREPNYQNAILISQALLRAARKNPLLARTAVNAYACGARVSDKLLLLTVPDHARFGRALIDLVRLVDLDWLRWRIVCFKTGEELPISIPEKWRELLELPTNTPIHWVASKNKANRANANHIAVEVIEKHGCSQEVSSNFHSVMLFGNVVEIWRLVS